jgi:hypothetical protein
MRTKGTIALNDRCSCHHCSQFSYLHLASRTLHFYTIPSIPDYYCTSEDNTIPTYYYKADISFTIEINQRSSVGPNLVQPKSGQVLVITYL